MQNETKKPKYRNRKKVKKEDDGKCSVETLSTLHADGHRFGKTKWRAITEKSKKRRGAKRKRERAAVGGCADHDSHRIDSLCASLPRHHRRVCFSSPNFVANLRATKSAPFDFTLIRC